MEKASIFCAKCLNPQPIFRECSMCDVKTYYTCIGEDCWGIKPTSPGKIPFWMCYNCQPEYNKENQDPNEMTALQQKKYATELLSNDETDAITGKKREYLTGRPVGKNNYFTMEFTASSARNTSQKTCSRCGNTQPVFRGCIICQSRNYYTCVSPDCWDLPETCPVWVCCLCKYDHGKSIKKSVTHPQGGISEEIDESTIFDLDNTDCESEAHKTDTERKSEIQKNEDKFIGVLQASGQLMSVRNDQKQTETQKANKSECESGILKNDEKLVGVLQASEEFMSARNEGIAEAKLAVEELDQQTVIREIEEAMTECYEDSYTARNFKKLRKFWEGISSGNYS